MNNIQQYQAENGDLALRTCLFGNSNRHKLIKSNSSKIITLLDMETLEVAEIDRSVFDGKVRWTCIDEAMALIDPDGYKKQCEILMRAFGACGISIK